MTNWSLNESANNFIMKDENNQLSLQMYKYCDKLVQSLSLLCFH